MTTRYLLLILLFCSTATFAQNTPINHLNIDKNKLSLEGYDAISYIAMNKAVKGNKDISYSYQGVTYRFSSKQNLEKFKASPDKFLPQYGGWCAYAMGYSGDKVEVDPETFKIKDGKLYLFYNAFFTNTLPKWNSDEQNLKIKADKNWNKTITTK